MDSSFNPAGLAEFIKLEKEQTNDRAKKVIDKIEKTLQNYIVEELKTEYGDDWWVNGIPLNIRKNVNEKYEEDNGKRGGKEFYFDLIHYKKIVIEPDNWPLFDSTLGYEKGSKDQKTRWIDFVNEKRKIVSHASSGINISFEDLDQIEHYGEWLGKQMSKINDNE